jgi:hypothetical protein
LAFASLSLASLIFGPLAVTLLMIVLGWIIDIVRGGDGLVTEHEIGRHVGPEEMAVHAGRTTRPATTASPEEANSWSR